MITTMLVAANVFFSAHFCQPDQPGGPAAVVYQPQGSLHATTDVTVSCPLAVAATAGIQRVYLAYGSADAAGAAPVVCKLWKIDDSDYAQAGLARVGVAGVRRGALYLDSAPHPAAALGLSIECRLKQGAKLLGYRLE